MRAGILLILGFGAAGCSNPEPDISAVLAVGTQAEQGEDQESAEFDFGPVVARDQTLRHEFPLANRSDRPLRIRGAKVNVPCCSSVGKLPETVPPGGVATIPVFFKAGHAAERKRVSFDIGTDSPSRPVRTLTLTAEFFPDWEVEEIGPSSGALGIGQASKRRLKITCRRKGGEGRRLAPEVTSSPNLRIGPTAEEGEFEGSNGVIEATKEFEVVLAGQAVPGPQLGTIAFRWPDGSMKSHEVRWEVNPSLRLSPPAFALPASDQSSTIAVVIRSDGRPFRVIAASGSLLNGAPRLPDDAKQVHHLALNLDTTKTAPDGKNEVKVVTDHPDQPTLVLPVLIIPREKGGAK